MQYSRDVNEECRRNPSEQGPVLITEEGSKGIKNFASFTILPDIHFLTYSQEEPLPKEIEDLHGPGKYIIAQISNAKAMLVPEGSEPSEDDLKELDALSAVAPGVKGYAVFQVYNSKKIPVR